jgi:hypothetical protein
MKDLRKTLADVGNLLGAPTCHYNQEVEREELLERVSKASALIAEALLPVTHDDLLNVLTAYEGAVSAVEHDGDDSPATLKELEDARAALLNVLRQCKVQIEEAA